MSIEKIIERAKRLGHIQRGFVLCDNCDNPADSELSMKLGWTCCGPCALGEADALDSDNFIAVDAAAARGEQG